MNAAQVLGYFELIGEAEDAIPRLRRFILELAVRGRLVDQDSSDEPASALLKRIETERTRRAAGGGASRAKPLPSVDDDEAPYAVPAGWCWVRIRQVTSDRGQKSPDKDFTYIDVTAIDKENGRIEGARVVSAADAPSRARKVVGVGDVIYSCVRPYLLNVAVIDKDISPPPIASTAFAVLNGFGLVLPKYLWIALRSPSMVERVESKMRGQAYPAINDSDFALLPLPLPPLPEQRRIVARVDELMALCDRLQAARNEREAARNRLTTASLARLNEPDPDPAVFTDHARFALDNLARMTTRPDQVTKLRQTILNLAVCGKLARQDPQDDSPRVDADEISYERSGSAAATRESGPFDDGVRGTAHYAIPANWIWVSTGKVCTAIIDCPHSTPKFQDSGVVCLDTNAFKNGALIWPRVRYVSEQTYTDRVRRLVPMEGDIVFAREGSVGESVVVPPGLRCCLGQRVMLFRPSAAVTSRYFQLAISEPSSLRRLLSLYKGIGARHVNVADMRNALIPLPPVAEQIRIVTRVDELMATCGHLEASLARGEESRSRLLQAVLHEALEPLGRIAA